MFFEKKSDGSSSIFQSYKNADEQLSRARDRSRYLFCCVSWWI